MPTMLLKKCRIFKSLWINCLSAKDQIRPSGYEHMLSVFTGRPLLAQQRGQITELQFLPKLPVDPRGREIRRIIGPGDHHELRPGQ